MSRWVLLIDDDRDNRELLSEFLELSGYEVAPCSTAADADALLARRGRPSVVVTDVKLPDLSGTTFVREMRARALFEDVPVIFVTGADSRTLGPVTDPVLTKPFDLDVLIGLIARVCPPAGPST